MKRWGKKLVGFLLLLLGAAMFLSNLGGLIGFLIIAALLCYGAKKLKKAETKGQKVFVFMVLGIALLVFLSLLPGVIPLILGGLCLYFGFKLMKTGEAEPGWEPGAVVSGIPAMNRPGPVDTSFEADWQEFVKRQNQIDRDKHQF